MTVKLHKLDFTVEYEFDLIGISSHQNDYRISWALNTELNFGLIKTDNLIVSITSNKENQIFSKYSYVDDDNLNLYHLISNRCDNGFLLEEYKNIDFILMIIGEYDKNFLPSLLNKIKLIDIIIFAFQIDIELLKKKSKTKLIF